MWKEIWCKCVTYHCHLLSTTGAISSHCQCRIIGRYTVCHHITMVFPFRPCNSHALHPTNYSHRWYFIVFIMVCWLPILAIASWPTSLQLGQWYNCPSANETTLKNISEGQGIWYKKTQRITKQWTLAIVYHRDCKSRRHIFWHCTSSLWRWWHAANLDTRLDMDI